MLPVVLRHALLSVALFFFIELSLLVFFRIQYPYDLEWLEGAFVCHVRRVLSGQPIYIKPSLEFTPYIYPPFYFYVSALVSKFTGVGYFPLRLVTVAASIGCFAIIFHYVRRETGSVFFGMISSALYAACFELGGASFDLAHLDCPMVFFLLLGVYLLRFHPSLRGACLAGTAMALAAFTKQPALIVAAPLCLTCLFVLGIRNGLFFTGSFALLFALVNGALHWSSDGWYTFYVFLLPGQQGYFAPMFFLYWTHDLFMPLPVASLLLFFSMYSRIKNWRQLPKGELDTLVLQVTFLGASLMSGWLGRLHIGGANNVVLPAYAAVALLFGIELQKLLKRFTYKPVQDIVAIQPYRNVTIRILLYAAAIYQFGSLFYNPYNYLPTPQDVKAGDSYVQALSAIKGEVFTPDQGYLPFLAGKKGYSHITTFLNIWVGHDEKVKNDLDTELTSALREQRFAAIIIDVPALAYPPFIEKIEKYYKPEGAVVKGDWSFGRIDLKKLNLEQRPWIYLPR